ncbi:MAG: hypothetical protein IJ193_06625 [Bacilli bacterium]|nr:hypothetical protein [Bacilli bacterium]
MKSKSFLEKHLGLIIYLSLLLVGCLLFIIPFIIGGINNKAELKKLYNEVEERLDETTSSTLHYEIEKVYRTNLKQYGVIVKFTTDKREESIAPATIKYELSDMIENGNYSLNLCKDYCLYEFSLFSKTGNKAIVREDHSLKQKPIISYDGKNLRYERLLGYYIGVLIFMFFITMVGGYIYVSSTKNMAVSLGAYLAKILVIYIVVGILSGGIGFIALPVLWVLEQKK